MTIVEEMTTDEYVGRRINDLLWSTRVTQTQLAEALELDQSTLSKKIRGRRRWTAREIVVTSGILGVIATDILPPEPLMLDMGGTLEFSPAVAAMKEAMIEESRLRESNSRPSHYKADSRGFWELAA